ncbi:MAG: hypothetical protein NTX87_20975 [Planctomycetota bacterium]|nr:hypothetical protein [Planctomycetota bacterium]
MRILGIDPGIERTGYGGSGPIPVLSRATAGALAPESPAPPVHKIQWLVAGLRVTITVEPV